MIIDDNNKFHTGSNNHRPLSHQQQNKFPSRSSAAVLATAAEGKLESLNETIEESEAMPGNICTKHVQQPPQQTTMIKIEDTPIICKSINISQDSTTDEVDGSSAESEQIQHSFGDRGAAVSVDEGKVGLYSFNWVIKDTFLVKKKLVQF